MMDSNVIIFSNVENYPEHKAAVTKIEELAKNNKLVVNLIIAVMPRIINPTGRIPLSFSFKPETFFGAIIIFLAIETREDLEMTYNLIKQIKHHELLRLDQHLYQSDLLF